jgi:hypothetical protein
MTLPVVGSGLDQTLDLGLGEVFARSHLGVGPLAWRAFCRDCAENSVWRHKLELRFCHWFCSFSLV